MTDERKAEPRTESGRTYVFGSFWEGQQRWGKHYSTWDVVIAIEAEAAKGELFEAAKNIVSFVPVRNEAAGIEGPFADAGVRLRAAIKAAEQLGWTCDWQPDDLNPGPDCPYCAGQMCARLDGLGCTHDRIERHG